MFSGHSAVLIQVKFCYCLSSWGCKIDGEKSYISDRFQIVGDPQLSRATILFWQTVPQSSLSAAAPPTWSRTCAPHMMTLQNIWCLISLWWLKMMLWIFLSSTAHIWLNLPIPWKNNQPDVYVFSILSSA